MNDFGCKLFYCNFYDTASDIIDLDKIMAVLQWINLSQAMKCIYYAIK